MKIINKYGRDDLAFVYVAEMSTGEKIECVESVQPPYTREQKWVLIVSTLFGCPVGCAICDAGLWYKGKLTKNEIIEQIDFLITSRYPDKKVPSEKFKIQVARMGDPALNMAVLDAIKELPDLYDIPGFLLSLSTVAPNGTNDFFDRLLEMRDCGRLLQNMQMQFSIHSTDEQTRNRLIPVNKWKFQKIAEFGRKFYRTDGKKISLNFALAKGVPVDVGVLKKFFDPSIFILKLTPVNPTLNAAKNNIVSSLDGNHAQDAVKHLINTLKDEYEVIVSIGELEENKIGSNCGQFVYGYLDRQYRAEVALSAQSYRMDKYITDI